MTFMVRVRVWLGIGILLAHTAALLLFPGIQTISLFFVLICSLSAAACCFWRSAQTWGPVRRKWDLLGSALSLWSIGALIFLLRLLYPALAHIRILGPEFYFFSYGIPVLLAISSSNEDRDTPLFMLIDSLQALYAVALVYLELSLLDLHRPMGGSNLSIFYGMGSWMLTAAVSLRLLGRPRGEERTLYRVLLIFLTCSAVLVTPVHAVAIFELMPLGNYRYLVADLVFLFLSGCCLIRRISPETERLPVETNSFALVLNNSSPILFTLAVLALGAMVARRHLRLGMAAIGVSLVTYCFRAALLQSAYIRAQHALTRSQFALREANARLRQISFHDALTGLPNRRQFDITIELEWNRALRSGTPLSLLLLDVDCFKALNDIYGHLTGDVCLQRIAGALQQTLRRAGEMVVRYGGEEFAAVLPNADTASAALVAESMRESVLALQMEHRGSLAGEFVTISVGVATAYPSAEGLSTTTLIAAADAALYRAKERGRNRVESQAQNLVTLSSPL
jgi:diguanylate cyclase (GGDEF)-like protein